MNIKPLLALLFLYSLSCQQKMQHNNEHAVNIATTKPALKSSSTSSKNYSKETVRAKEFVSKNTLSDSIYFLLDYTKHSGLNRCYIIDFNTGKKLDSGLVSHGCGPYPWGTDQTKDSVRFSNTNDSHLSSYGKYKIGKRGYSQWGININYKLHGLEESNSNAFKRIIVLHSWEMVTDAEIHPKGTVEGWGCPAVSNNFMRRIDATLQGIDKDVLLWIIKD